MANRKQVQTGSRLAPTKEADDARARNLLNSLNNTAQSARTSWFFFISLMAYLFIAVASVTHVDLLLQTAIKLPILQIDIGLRGFFLVAPVLFLLVYFGVRLHHAVLEQKAEALNQQLHDDDRRKRINPMRYEVSSYFFAQALAGPRESRIVKLLQYGTGVVTLNVLPPLLVLYFLVAFLPAHDVLLTNAHRAYVVASVGTLLLHTRMRMNTDLGKRLRRVSFAISTVGSAAVVLFSFLVATLPVNNDDNNEFFNLDQLATAIWPTSVPYDTDKDKCKPGRRCAFFLTAMLLERPVDYVSGQGGWFSRNLVIVNRPPLSTKVEDPKRETHATLRGRDLRYATLDRIDLSKADLTGADLSHARLLEANLQGASLTCADPGTRIPIGIRTQRSNEKNRHRDLLPMFEFEGFPDAQTRFLDLRRPGCTDLSGADLTKANLSHARLAGAKLRGTKLQSTSFYQADLHFAALDNANLTRADLTGARLSLARLRNTDVWGALLIGADLTHAELQSANFISANLQAADLRHANLSAANFSEANLAGAEMGAAKFDGAIFVKAFFVGVNLVATFGTHDYDEYLPGYIPDLGGGPPGLTTRASVYAVDFRDARIWRTTYADRFIIGPPQDYNDFRGVSVAAPTEVENAALRLLVEKLADPQLRELVATRLRIVLDQDSKLDSSDARLAANAGWKRKVRPEFEEVPADVLMERSKALAHIVCFGDIPGIVLNGMVTRAKKYWSKSEDWWSDDQSKLEGPNFDPEEFRNVLTGDTCRTKRPFSGHALLELSEAITRYTSFQAKRRAATPVNVSQPAK